LGRSRHATTFFAYSRTSEFAVAKHRRKRERERRLSHLSHNETLYFQAILIADTIPFAKARDITETKESRHGRYITLITTKIMVSDNKVAILSYWKIAALTLSSSKTSRPLARKWASWPWLSPRGSQPIL